jgi:hypothetical protein
MEPRAGLNECGNLSLTGIRSRNVQLVAIRYNHYAVLTQSVILNIITVEYKLVPYYCVETDRTGFKQAYNFSYMYIIAERQKVGCKNTFFVYVNCSQVNM